MTTLPLRIVRLAHTTLTLPAPRAPHVQPGRSVHLQTPDQTHVTQVYQISSCDLTWIPYWDSRLLPTSWKFEIPFIFHLLEQS